MGSWCILRTTEAKQQENQGNTTAWWNCHQSLLLEYYEWREQRTTRLSWTPGGETEPLGVPLRSLNNFPPVPWSASVGSAAVAVEQVRACALAVGRDVLVPEAACAWKDMLALVGCRWRVLQRGMESKLPAWAAAEAVLWDPMAVV